MIISHEHRFIFIKTRKTAGTSVEIALSRFCGPDDVITPIVFEEDERRRRELGYRGAQNYYVPLRFYSKTELLRRLWTRRRKEFINHVGVEFIRANVDKEIWDGYFKFCLERDPFDKAISRYYWMTEEPRPSIGDFLDSVPIRFLSDWSVYTINDQIAVDFVGRYENLAGDLATIKDKIGLPHEITLPRAKSGYRRDRQHYSAILDAKARARVELVCAKEIATFGYHWNEPQQR